MLDATIETSIFNVNGDSLPGPLIIGTFEKRAPELFKCNYDIGHLNLSKCLPAFYHEIITFWQDVIASNPKSKNDVLEQIVWNNKFIKSDKKSMYLQHWHYAGILKINDLFDTQQNCFPSFDSFNMSSSCIHVIPHSTNASL